MSQINWDRFFNPSEANAVLGALNRINPSSKVAFAVLQGFGGSDTVILEENQEMAQCEERVEVD